ncbi:MAG: hypothetical protein F7B20_02655 [Aeropyrum sp.]|nr:hypothetical protein [Aeropyrum sp.]MCE4616110.1 hypothetical protein [Aeropyrum sp.]
MPAAAIKTLARTLVEILAGIASEALKTFKHMMVGHAVDSLQLELDELENAFATMVFGSLAGMPLVPLGLALELSPHMEVELAKMLERHAKYRDAISEYAAFGG